MKSPVCAGFGQSVLVSQLSLLVGKGSISQCWLGKGLVLVYLLPSHPVSS